ncbi:MAG: branched-chain amino acid ABC transporter permease [Lautropia sp.]
MTTPAVPAGTDGADATNGAGRTGLAATLRSQRIRLVVLWLVMLGWPLIAPNDYILSLGVLFFVNLLLVASLNLVLGYAGQISLCHGALFGLGAYISGVLSVRYDLTPLLGMAAAVAGTALVASLIALPTLRLRGHYLAMGTLGFNAILSVLFVELVPLTGGPNGLAGIAPVRLFGFELDTPSRYFPLAWLCGLVAMWLILNLVASRHGRALRVVAGSEIAAGALGVDAFRLKVAVFAFSAALAGLAGALYAHFNLFASPETFGFFTSVLLIVMVALGGWGSYWGPLLGALVYTAVPELLRDVHDAELFIFGLCMILVLLYFENGLVGLFKRSRR